MVCGLRLAAAFCLDSLCSALGGGEEPPASAHAALAVATFQASRGFAFLFFFPPSFSNPPHPPKKPQLLNVLAFPGSPVARLACAVPGAPLRLPSPEPRSQRTGSRGSLPRDAAAGAGTGAAARSPRGLRASCGAGSGGGCLCYRDNVGAPCRGVTPAVSALPCGVVGLRSIYLFLSFIF